MSKLTDKQKKDVIDSIKVYVRENGIKVTDDFFIWNTYPVVVKDICVSYVVVNGDKLEFGDFPSKYDNGKYVGDDVSIELWNCRKTEDDFSSLKGDREYLENAFKAMKITDGKKLNKR